MSQIKNYYLLLFLIFSAFFPTYHLNAQDDEDLIKKSILTMFDGMAIFDSAMVRSVFAENFVLKSVVTLTDAGIRVRDQSAQDFLNTIPKYLK
jgi:hypothetical protein